MPLVVDHIERSGHVDLGQGSFCSDAAMPTARRNGTDAVDLPGKAAFEADAAGKADMEIAVGLGGTAKQIAEQRTRLLAKLEISSEDEIAEVLHISVRTVKRDWRIARAWLYGELRSDGAPQASEE